MEEPDGIFFFCTPLVRAEEFFGREREKMKLLNRTRRGNSTSVVGQRRIGKTWLLSYLGLVAHQELGKSARIAYLSADLPTCQTLSGFVSAAIQAFGMQVAQERTPDLKLLQKVVEELRNQHTLPVLCLDEFEGFGNRQVFDLNFFSGMRAIAETSGLVLVTASKISLIDLVGEIGKTSGFFNMFQQIRLKPFSDPEVEDFLANKEKLAGFTNEESQRLRQYGQNLPVRLQLAGQQLLEDKMVASRSQKPTYYRPDDEAYWQDFEEELEDSYRAIVKKL